MGIKSFFLKILKFRSEFFLNQETHIGRLMNKMDEKNIQEEVDETIKIISEKVNQSKRKEDEYSINPEYEELLAQHLDTAISIPSFVKFPLETLFGIFKHPSLRIKDHHHICKFLLDTLENYKEKASPLFECLNLIKLSPQEAINVLDNKILDKKYIGRSASEVASHLLKQNSDIKKQMSFLSQRIEEIEQYDFESEFERIQEAFESLHLRINEDIPSASSGKSCDIILQKKLEEKLKKMGEAIEKQINHHENGFISTQEKTRSEVREALLKLRQIEAGFEPLRAECNEMRREIQSILVKQRNLESRIGSKGMIPPTDTVEIPFTGHPFEGILAYLSDLCKGNVTEKNVCIITASSIKHGRPDFVSMRSPPDYFQTDNKVAPWIKFDFKERSVSVVNYSIKVSNIKIIDYMKDWILEGSNNDEDYELIDSRSTTAFRGVHKSQTFPSKHVGKKYRYIKLSRPEQNCYLSLKSVDFFGTLYAK